MALKSQITNLLKSIGNQSLPSTGPLPGIMNAWNGGNQYFQGKISKDAYIKALEGLDGPVMGLTGGLNEPAPKGKFEVMLLTKDGRMVSHSVHDTFGLAKQSAERIPMEDNINHISIRDVTPAE